MKVAILICLGACLASAPGTALGQVDAGVPQTADADVRAPAMSDAEDEPRPDQASGVIRGGDRTNKLLWIPRVLLFLPRVALYVIAAPTRLALWSADRFEITQRIADLLSGTGPLQLGPAARLESGLGVSLGLGFAVEDLMGRGERLRGEALFLGGIRQLYRLKLSSGTLLGDRVEVDFEGEFQLLQNSRFFGYGVSDVVDFDAAAPPINPILDNTAVEGRFDQDIFRVEAGASIPWSRGIATRVSSTLTFRTFDSPDEDLDDVRDVYDSAALPGLDEGLSNIYTEVSAIYDSRRQESRYLSRALSPTGWKLDGFIGYAAGFADDPSGYFRYGLDVQRYFDLYAGNRILVLRSQLEAVSGDIEDVPFVDLPSLGGSRVMRGYLSRRFRDRVLAFGSVDYQYPISQSMSGYLFVDAGTVARTLDGLDAGAMRYGTGGGILVHTKRSILMRLQAGVGSEGVVFNLSFSPVTRVKRRSKRR